jgi:RDD family
MHAAQSVKNVDARDTVRAEDLNVTPALLGAPLARPGRRLLAITLDVAVVALLSNLGNLWLVGGLVLIALLWLHGLPWAERARSRQWLLIGLAVALLAIGAQQAWVTGELIAPPHVAKDDDLPESIPGLTPEQNAQARIALLQAQLEAARHRSAGLREQLSEWIDEVGLGLGWAIAYFTLLPVWWNGQTLGKRLLGLRAVELTGKPMTALRAFKRYGGYAAGMATGGFGFAQVLWDANRQAIQDKTAHTVVIDLRRRRDRADPAITAAEAAE